MIFLIIGALLIVYSRFDYKKSFLMFLAYKFFLVTNITLISIPGIPLLTLDLFLTLYYVFIFLYNEQNKKQLFKRFPYRIPFVALAISWLLSTIFSAVGFSSAMSEFVKELFSQLLLIWVIWEMIKKKSDWIFLLNCITVCVFITCLYGYYEKITQSNPLVAYQATLVDSSRAINFSYDEEIGRGFRTQSVFEHAIGAGINWALYVVFVFTLYFKYNLKLVNWFSLLVAIMCIPCILFTNSRAPLVFLGIGSLAYINLKSKKFIIISVLLVTMGLVVGSSLFEEYAANILSIFDSSYQKEVGGSNSDMRLEQLAAALSVMERSPIFGLGYKFLTLLENDIHASALLGLESIWFRVLTQFGILGILSYLLYSLYSLVIVPRKFSSFPVFIISLAYWITASLTSTPGMLAHFYFIVLIFFIRVSISQSKKRIVLCPQSLKYRL